MGRLPGSGPNHRSLVSGRYREPKLAVACGSMGLGRPASAPKYGKNTDTLAEKRKQILHVGSERSSCLSQKGDAFHKKLCPFLMDVDMG